MTGVHSQVLAVLTLEPPSMDAPSSAEVQCEHTGERSGSPRGAGHSPRGVRLTDSKELSNLSLPPPLPPFLVPPQVLTEGAGC